MVIATAGTHPTVNRERDDDDDDAIVAMNEWLHHHECMHACACACAYAYACGLLQNRRSFILHECIRNIHK